MMNRYRSLLLVGPPGSGKGTQGRALGVLPGLFHCACGDVFRSLDLQTELGREFLAYSSKGLLVPDDLTIQLWRSHIRRCVENHRFNPATDQLVLDGIPRTAQQAALMDEFIEVELVLHLSGVPRDQIALRLKRRAVKDNRLDDASDEVVQRRFDLYQNESAALLSHYPERLLCPINAALPAQLVLQSILTAVNATHPEAASSFFDTVIYSPR
jgi:adenylate kinase